MRNTKRKIVNDPVWGFIELNNELLFNIIEHPYFQRLRRIKQLGLSCLVYPGANHTRFEHALGAMHLVRQAIEVLRKKGNEVTEHEEEGVMAAILLHDMGHGPFSHALETSIVKGLAHEKVSLLFMHEMNRQWNGKLDTAIAIFKGSYRKKFLHQLVSSQLDMDRLDFLKRDSFYSGVSEGVVSSDRIIKMLNVRNDELVVEVKGIYSIEKFLIARRLMYWQVYLHKTVLAAEYMLIKVLERAREIVSSGGFIFASPALARFLKGEIDATHFLCPDEEKMRSALDCFAKLDDNDLLYALKEWQNHPDFVLSKLAGDLVNRRLFKIKLRSSPIPESKISILKEKIRSHYALKADELDYFVVHDEITNIAIQSDADRISILFKNGKIKDIQEASDINLAVFAKAVRKYFVCYVSQITHK